MPGPSLNTGGLANRNRHRKHTSRHRKHTSRLLRLQVHTHKTHQDKFTAAVHSCKCHTDYTLIQFNYNNSTHMPQGLSLYSYPSVGLIPTSPTTIETAAVLCCSTFSFSSMLPGSSSSVLHACQDRPSASKFDLPGLYTKSSSFSIQPYNRLFSLFDFKRYTKALWSVITVNLVP